MSKLFCVEISRSIGLLLTEVPQSVFTILLRHGRLSLPGLLQYSALSLRVLKAGLVTLLQQHLVFHHLGGEGLTYYEANLDSAYILARSGKVLDILEDKFGPAGEEIARTLMSEGHATLTDLAEAYGVKDSEEETDQHSVNGDHMSNGVNGQKHDRHTTGQQIRSLTQLQRLLEQMKRAGYVVAVTRKSFVSPADVDFDAGLLARSNLPVAKAPNGKKQREEFARTVNSFKRRWRDGGIDNEDASDTDEDDTDEPPKKKTKTNDPQNAKKRKEELSKADNPLKRRRREGEDDDEDASQANEDAPPVKKAKANGLTNGVNGTNKSHNAVKQDVCGSRLVGNFG